MAIKRQMIPNPLEKVLQQCSQSRQYEEKMWVSSFESHAQLHQTLETKTTHTMSEGSVEER